MKRYSDYDEQAFKNPDFPWSKFIIVADTEADKKELLEAFRHIHYADIDTDFIIVNQLAHLYLDNQDAPCRIVVK